MILMKIGEWPEKIIVLIIWGVINEDFIIPNVSTCATKLLSISVLILIQDWVIQNVLYLYETNSFRSSCVF